MRLSEYPVDHQARLPTCARVAALLVYVGDSCKNQFLVQWLQNGDFSTPCFPLYQLAFYWKENFHFSPIPFPLCTDLFALPEINEYGLVDSFFIQWVIILPIFHYFDGQIVSGDASGLSSGWFLCSLIFFVKSNLLFWYKTSQDHMLSSMLQPWNQPLVQETFVSFSRVWYLDPLSYFSLCTDNIICDPLEIGLNFKRR